MSNHQQGQPFTHLGGKKFSAAKILNNTSPETILFGTRLRAARVAAGLTQKTLHDMTNIALAFICRVEAGGNCSLLKAGVLAAAVRKPLHILLMT